MGKTCCFTGQRPAKLFGGTSKDPYDYKNYRSLLAELIQRVAHLYDIGVDVFLTGGAQGVDQIAYRAVEEVRAYAPKIRNVVCLPFRGYGERWKPTGPFSQEDLDCICETASEVIYVNDHSPADKRAAISMLFERNQYMVDRSDIVIGVSREEDAFNGKGGTAACLRYAAKQNKKVQILRPLNDDMTEYQVTNQFLVTDPSRITHANLTLEELNESLADRTDEDIKGILPESTYKKIQELRARNANMGGGSHA